MAQGENGPESWSSDQWQNLFREVVARTARLGENVEDVVAGGWMLAERRAGLLGRAMAPGEDVPYALSIFCWWPFKPSLRQDSRSFLYGVRADIFSGAAISGRWREDVGDLVSDDILTMKPEELFAVLHDRPVWEFVRERVGA